MITGMDASTGRSISGDEHLRQSIADILSTRKGTRLMRPEYGSRIPGYVDQPLSRSTIVDIVAETAQALALWEPRIRVNKVTPSQGEPGGLILDIKGVYLVDGKALTMEGIQI